jgi:DNA repair protein RecO (recombination protein O)
MERFQEQAVVLSTLDYADADRLVTLFTHSRGKLTAFASGARKSKRRFAGALQPLTLIRAQLVERRGDTFRLDAAEILETFTTIRQDLPRIARALYCLELCRELVRDREPHPALFALLLDYLRLLDQRAAGPSSVIAFELSALAHAGLMPRFDQCALCGGPLGREPRFDPQHGGAVCGGCTNRARDAIRVSSQLVQSMSAIQAGERSPLPAATRQRARELLNIFIAHHIGRQLKSVAFMTQVGLD